MTPKKPTLPASKTPSEKQQELEKWIEQNYFTDIPRITEGTGEDYE